LLQNGCYATRDACAGNRHFRFSSAVRISPRCHRAAGNIIPNGVVVGTTGLDEHLSGGAAGRHTFAWIALRPAATGREGVVRRFAVGRDGD